MHGVKLSLVAMASLAWTLVGCGVDTKSGGAVRISSITPDTGSITGGTSVTIAGSGLDDGTNDATVVFGAVPAEVTSVNESAIVVKLPSGLTCGEVDVQITNGNGGAIRQRGFTYEGGNGTIEVTAVDPPTGDLAGGSTVTITGSGFTGGVGISLGGSPLRNVTVVSNTEVTGTVPPRTTGGAVDLLVRNCSSQDSLENGFTFTSGLNGGYVEMNQTSYPNPGQFDPANPPTDFVDPYAFFVEPTSAPMLNALPTVDTCTLNYIPASSGTSGGPIVYLDAGPAVHYTSGAKLADVPLQNETIGGTTYFDYFYPAGDPRADDPTLYVPVGTYSFGIDGSALLDSFEVAGAFIAPASYNVSAPNLYATTPATVSKTANLQFTWTGGVAGDLFQIFFVGFNNAGSSDLNGDGVPRDQVLYCLATDDGSFQVPGTNLNSLGAAVTQTLVYTRRRRVGEFVSPANGSRITTLTFQQKVGYLRF